MNKIYQKILFSPKKFEQVDSCQSMFTFDCLFHQYTEEWAVPIDKTASALSELQTLTKSIEKSGGGVHFPIEIRFSARESDIWLSPAVDGDVCWIGVIVYKPFGFVNKKKVQSLFVEMEKIMLRNNGKPHWAKGWHLDKLDIAPMYSHFNRFLEIRHKLDPQAMFSNDYTDLIFGLDPTTSIKKNPANSN